MIRKPIGHPQLMKLYQDLNRQFFSGRLPKIPCVFNNRLSATMGRTHFERKSSRAKWKPVLIDISASLETVHLRKTMVHEMCHVWCCIQYQDQNHSEQFWQKMADCGFPSGHQQSGATSQDMWQTTEGTTFRVGERVYFMNNDERVDGTIIRINRRTITIEEASGENCWRVAPSLLQRARRKRRNGRSA